MSGKLSLMQELTVFLLNTVDSIFKFDINIKGLDKLPDAPVLFVPNHFTRAETVLIPYFLFEYRHGKFIRSLADEQFFEGKLGKLLDSIGTLSIGNENRNEIIINTLKKNEADWVIYPEGSMIKNKHTVTEDGDYSIDSPYWQGSMRTGAIVMAIKAELARLNSLSEGFDASEQPIYVVPVNVSYYPIRGENKSLKSVMKQFGLSEKMQNELALEANLLFNSRININISTPFNINECISGWYNFFNKFPLLSQKKKNNLVLEAYRQKLTSKMAIRIYNSLTINIEHLLAFYLYEKAEKRLNIYKLKRFIIRAILLLMKNPKNNLGDKLIADEILILLIPKKYEPFERIIALGKSLGIFIEDGDNFIINHEELKKQANFYDAPIKIPFRVIYNEFLAMTKIIKPMRELLHTDFSMDKQSFANEVVNLDKSIFYNNYQKYHKKNISTKYEYGEPFFLPSKKVKIGVVFSHGYLACPQEIRQIADSLNQQDDIAVYGVRLAGHGTIPENMKDITWKDWLQSYWNGVAATLNEYDYLFLGGFSTGGLLSLIYASELNERLAGVFAINPPINLRDIRSHFVPIVNVWNDMLNAFNLNTLKYEYIDNNPSYPDTNYKQNYLSGVQELGKLTKILKKRLNKVSIPTLIINSKNDEIVDAKSSQYIYDNVNTDRKRIHHLDTDKHVIVRGDFQDEVTEHISNFIKDVIKGKL